MAGVARAAAITAQAAQVSGVPGAHIVFGIANVIVEAANNVRVNKAAAIAFAQRVNEMAATVASILEDGGLGARNASALQVFQQTLVDAQDALIAQGQRSYLAQLLSQQRDKDNLLDLSERVNNAFSTLMVELRIHASNAAVALSAQFETLLAQDTAHLSVQRDPDVQQHTPIRVPAKPQLHFGRAAETDAVVDAIVSARGPAGRVAVLGGPGMGKTSLAVTTLHHPAVAERFGARRFFVACDAAEDHENCLGTIAAAFGIVASDAKATQHKLGDAIGPDPAVLVLDNFESAWEDPARRAEAERVLQFLDAIESLSLIVTLRGAERPRGVRWTRPFLPPLAPLTDVAAIQAFLSIAEVPDSDPNLRALLKKLDNVPLAVILMANLAQTESAEALLERWNDVETSMLVRGKALDRHTSLDMSISVSLQSPRMLALPAAQNLLRTLALLPNGVVDTDLRLWKIQHSTQALAALLQTSLATRGPDQRLRVLAPIRSFMLSNHPPSEDNTATVYQHYFTLAELCRQTTLFKLDNDVFAAVAAELANIESLVRHALKASPTAVAAAVKAVSPLSILYTQTGMGSAPELLPLAVNAARDAQLDSLRADLLLQWGRMAYSISVLGDPQALVREARELYERAGSADGAFDARIFLAEYLPTPAAIDEARALYELAKSRDNTTNMLRSSFELGTALLRDGRPLEAIEQHELAIEILEKMPEPERPMRLVASNRYQLGELYRAVGRVPDAIKSYGAARDAFAAVQSAQGVSVILTQLADTYLYTGRPHDTIEHATQALAAHQAAGFRNRRRCLLLIALAHAMLGNADEAAGAMSQVDAMSAAGGLSTFEECIIMRTRGALALWIGDVASARALLCAAREKTRQRDIIEAPEYMLSIEASVMALLSEVEAAEDNKNEAANLAICASGIFRKTGQASEIPHCLALLAEVVDDEFAEVLVDVVALPAQRLGYSRGLGIVLLRSAYVALGRGRKDVARHRAAKAMQHFGDVIDGRRLALARMILDDA